MNSPIVVIGSLNADFVIRVDQFPLAGQTLVGRDFRIHPGGKGANQACAAARLGAGVHMVGQVGNDAQAEWLRANLAAAGVDVSHVFKDTDVASGVAAITIDTTGQNQIIIVPGANGTFTPDRLERSEQLIKSARLLLLQLEIPIETVAAAARLGREAGATVILDPAPAKALPDELLTTVDYLTPNETELAILTGARGESLNRQAAVKLARQLVARGAGKVIAKLGSLGAILVSAENEHFWPAIPVNAVDTTAAGDAFNGSFAAALARGRTEQEAGDYAVAAAACSVTKPGAQPSLPTESEVQSLLALVARGGGLPLQEETNGFSVSPP